jgi:hypothetical protein
MRLLTSSNFLDHFRHLGKHSFSSRLGLKRPIGDDDDVACLPLSPHSKHTSIDMASPAPAAEVTTASGYTFTRVETVVVSTRVTGQRVELIGRNFGSGHGGGGDSGPVFLPPDVVRDLLDKNAQTPIVALVIRACKLDALPRELSQLKFLHELDVSDNALADLPVDLLALTSSRSAYIFSVFHFLKIQKISVFIAIHFRKWRTDFLYFKLFFIILDDFIKEKSIFYEFFGKVTKLSYLCPIDARRPGEAESVGQQVQGAAGVHRPPVRPAPSPGTKSCTRARALRRIRHACVLIDLVDHAPGG